MQQLQQEAITRLDENDKKAGKTRERERESLTDTFHKLYD